MRKRGPRPGGSARRKYQDMRRLWRRRNRRLFWTLAGGFVLIAAVANVAAQYEHRWAWGAGVLTGALLAVITALYQEPPAHIQQWEIGAWGEEATAKRLRQLDAQWRVLHDVEAGRRGNFDHIVIGPPGVFLLDTKKWQGEVTVDGEVPTLRRLEDPDLSCVFDGLPRRMRGLAAELHDRYRESGLRPGWVTPVVVVWARFPQRVVGGDKLTFVHGDHIAAWLLSQPPRLRADQVEQMHTALADTSNPRMPRWRRLRTAAS